MKVFMVMRYGFAIFFAALALYAVYKGIWYAVCLFRLRRALRAMAGEGAEVRMLRRLIAVPFSAQGLPIARVSVNGREYVLSLLSFASVHSRWYVEMGAVPTVEVRKRRRIFYSVEKHSEKPDAAIAYGREWRMARRPLRLASAQEELAGQYLLVYPRPRELAVAGVQLSDLVHGDRLGAHTVAYLEDLPALMDSPAKKTDLL